MLIKRLFMFGIFLLSFSASAQNRWQNVSPLDFIHPIEDTIRNVYGLRCEYEKKETKKCVTKKSKSCEMITTYYCRDEAGKLRITLVEGYKAKVKNLIEVESDMQELSRVNVFFHNN